MGERGSNQSAQVMEPAADLEEPAHERVNAQVAAQRAGQHVVSGILAEDENKLVAAARVNDGAQATQIVRGLTPVQREQVKTDLQDRGEFDALPLWLQYNLSPTNPFHQAHEIGPDGAISCTTAVRIEGVTADQVLAVLKQSWQPWWATSTVTGWTPHGGLGGPTFNFVPESTLRHGLDFHLRVDMAPEVREGSGYKLPAHLDGSFTGSAEMFIESVDGGVVVHDTWMGMQLTNTVMKLLGGAGFWTNGHLSALVGGMGMGLGSTGFAGLREYMLARRGTAK